ncbi:MAG TPA: hypothetical protein VG323_20555, partial [Thermoanaerobaculia bacterium]|nr:hypothetical protein [Thermoanaerobaculia bacterium]
SAVRPLPLLLLLLRWADGPARVFRAGVPADGPDVRGGVHADGRDVPALRRRHRRKRRAMH